MKSYLIFQIVGVSMLVFGLILLIVFEVIPHKQVDDKTVLLGLAIVLSMLLLFFGKLDEIQSKIKVD